MRNTRASIAQQACILAIVLPFVACATAGRLRSPRNAGAGDVGYFGVVKQGEHWSLVTPQGQEFFSIGMNKVVPVDDRTVSGQTYDGIASHGGVESDWRSATLQRLDTWNFNTLGAWSIIRGRPYVVELSLSYSYIDVFDKEFEHSVIDAAMAASERKDIATTFNALDKDPLLIGYFTDNEFAWGQGYEWAEDGYSLFEYYASLDPDSPGKQAWVSYMAGAYQHDWERLSSVWNVAGTGIGDLSSVERLAPRSPRHFAEAERVADDFLRRVAERYFDVTSRVMRARLPHHLNLGTRMTDGVPGTVAEVAARYVDVLSFNMYARDPDLIRAEVSRLHSISQKPVLLTEFAFPARINRSGNTNKGYERAEVENDRERAASYARFADTLSALPFVVGFHWFQYFDESGGGRADGENANFGFVDVHDRVYEDLVSSATTANAAALRRRAGERVAKRRAA